MKEQFSDRKIKMVLDVDTGIDDALALSYAAGHPDVELLGVTVSYGNVVLGQGVRNTLDLLSALGREDVPVYAGASNELSHQGEAYHPNRVVQWIHGSNGIGEVVLPESAQKVQKEEASDFLVRMAETYKNQLVVVAVGPQTNVASAMGKDPSFEENVAKIVIMGGALTVPGNTTPLAEANIYNDPVAAARVFNSKAEVTMVGLDVTYRTLITKQETADGLPVTSRDSSTRIRKSRSASMLTTEDSSSASWKS